MKSYRIISLSLGVCLLAAAGLAEARPWSDSRHQAPGHGHYERHGQGRVLSSTPIYRYVTTPVREKRCYDLPRGRHHGHGRPAQKCEMVTSHEKRKEITGYKVKYEYRGRIYWTESRHEPGRFIEHRR